MPKRPIRADDLLKIVYVGDPQLSPDGSRVLYTQKTVNDKNKYITNLFSVDLEGRLTQWTQGETGNGGGRWSPDGASIAFISRRDTSAQIHLIPTTGGEAKKLTKLPEGSISEIQWSPDGRWIAFSFREQASTLTEAAKKEREAKGLSQPPIEIDDIWYRMDGDGYFAGQRFKLYAVEISTGKFANSTSDGAFAPLYSGASTGVFSFNWSPNSLEIAVMHSASKRPFADPPND